MLDIFNKFIIFFSMNRGFSEKELASFLQNIIGQKKDFNQQKILESLVLFKIEALFSEIIPDLLRDHLFPYKFKAGTLYISVDHGIYAQQIQLQKDEILQRLHQSGSIDIQKIEIHVGKTGFRNYKTEDIMSRNEKMTSDQPKNHENADLLDQLISGLKKIQQNSSEEM